MKPTDVLDMTISKRWDEVDLAYVPHDIVFSGEGKRVTISPNLLADADARWVVIETNPEDATTLVIHTTRTHARFKLIEVNADGWTFEFVESWGTSRT